MHDFAGGNVENLGSIRREVVLASASPRRKQLLEDAGIAFRVEAPDIEEWNAEEYPDLSHCELAKLNAERKAQVVSVKWPEAFTLAADTVVICKGKMLGKPRNYDEARQMLEWLSGETHEVLTAVVGLIRSTKECRECVVRTWVTFKKLNEEVLQEYVDTVHVLDKAGAYALQEKGDLLVERIEGSRSNVIGLPMEVVGEWLGLIDG